MLATPRLHDPRRIRECRQRKTLAMQQKIRRHHASSQTVPPGNGTRPQTAPHCPAAIYRFYYIRPSIPPMQAGALRTDPAQAENSRQPPQKCSVSIGMSGLCKPNRTEIPVTVSLPARHAAGSPWKQVHDRSCKTLIFPFPQTAGDRHPLIFAGQPPFFRQNLFRENIHTAQ